MMKKKKALWFAPLLVMLFVLGIAIQGAVANEFEAGASAPVIKADKAKYNIGQKMFLQVNDADSAAIANTIAVTITSSETGASCTKTLKNGGSTGSQFGDAAGNSDDAAGGSNHGVAFSLTPYSSANGAVGHDATLEVARTDTITITFTSADGDSASITRAIGYEEGVFTGTTTKGLVVGASTINSDAGTTTGVLTAENADYAPANISVYLKDNDLNGDSTVQDTVKLDVVTASGSSQTLTLKESGKNTGVFYGKVAAAYADTTSITDANGVEHNGLPNDDGTDTPCVVTVSGSGDTVTLKYDAANMDVLPDGSEAHTSFDIPLGLGTKGTIAVDKENYLRPDVMTVTITDPDLNANPNAIDTFPSTTNTGVVSIKTVVGTEAYTAPNGTFSETGPNTGVFTANFTFDPNETANDNDSVIKVGAADTITVKYNDAHDGNTDPVDNTVSTTASYSMVNGTVSISPTIAADGTNLTIDITDPDRNLSSTTIDTFTSNTSTVATTAERATNAAAGYVKIESTQGDILAQDALGDQITLTETGVNTNIFRTTVGLNIGSTVDNDGILDAATGDTLTVTYYDPDDATGSNTSTITATALAQSQVAGLAFDASSYEVNGLVTVTLTDNDLNTDATTKQTDNTSLTLKSTTNTDGVKVNLTETDINSGVFQGKVRLSNTTNDIATGIDALNVAAGDTLTLEYNDTPAGLLQATATVEANTGTIELSKTSLSLVGDVVTVTVKDNDLNTSATAINSVAAGTTLIVKSNSDATGTGIKLTETDIDTGIFTGTFKTGATTVAGAIPTIKVANGDNLSVVYKDAKNAALQTNALVTATATAGEELAAITFDTDKAILGETTTITVSDRDADTSAGAKNSINVNVFSNSDPIGITLTLLETDVHTGIFSGTVKTSAISTITQTQVKAAVGDNLSVSYIDTTDADPVTPQTKVVESIPVAELAALTAEPASVTVAPEGTASVTVSGGTSPYTVASADTSIATAVVAENTVTITGVAAGGPVDVTVTDADSNTATVAVTVEKVVTPEPVPTGQNSTKLTGDDIANAPVNLGSVVTGGGQMQLALSFPAYAAAVDEYVAVQTPDGALFFVGSDNTLTTELVPYATGVTDAKAATIFDAFSICSPFGGAALVPTGTWTIYSLVLPANGGDLSTIDWAAGDYDLQYYSFAVSCSN